MTNPDDSEHLGVMKPPFIANDGTGNGYYGSGMASIWPGSEKLGPYSATVARHQFMQSNFHRSLDFCGTCHDVSNPAVGNLAYNYGSQPTADPVVADGTLGGPVDGKAAFNNFPYMYGIVERTFSEFKSGVISQTLVADYLSLPDGSDPNLPNLQAGALQAGYDSAMATVPNGPNYEDSTPRYFTCQTCHMRPVTGVGCNKKGAPSRTDLPLHDMTGGNYWMPDAILYLDGQGKLLLGGGLREVQRAALNDGKTRALKQLSEAITLQVDEQTNTLRVVNLTGHKVISGYPEGRRMWLNIKWEDKDGNLLREDGKYGTITVDINGTPTQVETILDLYDPNNKIYEAHYGMTQEWAAQLISLGYPDSLALSYDRITGAVDFTLGELAAQPPGTYHETFHFELNNAVVKDNRIPPYGMSKAEARIRNALPVPETQYNGGTGNYIAGKSDLYDYWDEVALNPPAGAVYAKIDMLYQPTSWEYIQFLYLANNGTNPFLANEGVNLLDAWLNATPAMAPPYTMASAEWGKKEVPPTPKMLVETLTTWLVDRKGNLVEQKSVFASGDMVGIIAHVVDESGTPLSGAQVFLMLIEPATPLQGFTDTAGDAIMAWKVPRKNSPPTVNAEVTDVIKSGYVFDPALGQTSVTFFVQ
jgi:hypothetical protein